MSRCFPFPPPGYERKHKPEDSDILKEARRKEKKHKKEKDKERKKEKEKGKDESDEKQDKKDRKKNKDKKEKHKDKKKDKEDRSKDKEKRSISDESTVSGVKLEDKNGDKLHPEGHSNNRSHVDAGKHSTLFQRQNGTGPSQISLPLKGTDEPKLVPAFPKQVDKLHPEGHVKDRRHVVDAGKHSALLQGRNGTGPSKGVLPSKGNDESKFVQELGRRISDDGARGSKLLDRATPVEEWDRRMGAKAAVGNSSLVLGKEKGKNRDKGVDVKSLDVEGPTNVSRGYAMVPQHLPPVDGGEVGRILRPLDDQSNGTPGVKEKLKETDDGKRGDKRKERDKKSHGKEKHKNKEKKRSKSEKDKNDKKVKTERQKIERAKLDAVGVSAGGGVVGNESTGAVKEVKISGSNEGNLRKRKDMYTNGFIHETETSAYKMQKHSPHQSVENGSQPKAFSTPTKSYDEHATRNSVAVDYNGRLMNGMIEAQRPSIPNHFSAAVVHDQVAEVPKGTNQKHIPLKEMSTMVPNQKPIPSKVMPTTVPNQKPIPSKEMPTTVLNQKPIPSKEMPTTVPNQKPIPSKEMPTKLSNQKPISLKETQTLPNLEDVIAEVPKAPEQKPIHLKEMPTKVPNQKSIPLKEMQTKPPNQKSIPSKEISAKVPKQKSTPSKEASTVPSLEDLIAEASRKPPHPDSKYLSEALRVPSVADLVEDDDQEWFFCKRDPLDKPKTEPVQTDKELIVWSEAVRIEQADICALPYVIPY